MATRSAISAGFVMSAPEYFALMPNSFSRPERIASIASLSPKPLSMMLAPSAASARAVASPMPEVEPVTSAVLPLSMEILVT